MNRHTPGPWRLEYGTAPSGSPVPFITTGDGTFTLATLIPHEGFAANGRLMAEAPLMLEELRSVERALLENIHEDCGSAGPDPQPPEPATARDYALVAVLMSVRAVIAKADGR